MKLNAILAVSAVALLAACGGGSSGTNNEPLGNYSTLRVFSDGAGVARGAGVDGSQALVITPDVTLVVQEANSVTESDLARIQVSDFPIVQQLASNANMRVGAYTLDGITVNVTAIEDLGGEAAVFVLDIPNYGSLVMAAGSGHGSTPSGVYNYAGTLGVGRRIINANPELGSFSMSADFSNRTFSYTGNTTSNSLNATGVLDIVNGRFTTNSFVLTTSGIQRSGTMYGQIHGNSAESISGVFHTGESNPAFAGAFVGSR